MRTRRLLAATAMSLALPAALLSGCGDDDGSATTVAEESSATPSPTATPTPSEEPAEEPSASATSSASASALPPCADVWQDGGTLPGRYDGCDDDGREVPAESRYCEFGKPLVTFGDRFWAVPGGRISETGGPLLEDDGYRSALRSCSG